MDMDLLIFRFSPPPEIWQSSKEGRGYGLSEEKEQAKKEIQSKYNTQESLERAIAALEQDIIRMNEIVRQANNELIEKENKITVNGKPYYRRQHENEQIKKSMSVVQDATKKPFFKQRDVAFLDAVGTYNNAIRDAYNLTQTKECYEAVLEEMKMSHSRGGKSRRRRRRCLQRQRRRTRGKRTTKTL